MTYLERSLVRRAASSSESTFRQRNHLLLHLFDYEARSFHSADCVLRSGAPGGSPPDRRGLAPAALLPPPWSAPLCNVLADSRADGSGRLRQTHRYRALDLPLLPRLHNGARVDDQCAGRSAGEAAGARRAGSRARSRTRRRPPQPTPQRRRPRTSRHSPELKSPDISVENFAPSLRDRGLSLFPG